MQVAIALYSSHVFVMGQLYANMPWRLQGVVGAVLVGICIYGTEVHSLYFFSEKLFGCFGEEDFDTFCHLPASK